MQLCQLLTHQVLTTVHFIFIKLYLRNRGAILFVECPVSVLCIPTGHTYITSDMRVGIHISLGLGMFIRRLCANSFKRTVSSSKINV